MDLNLSLLTLILLYTYFKVLRSLSAVQSPCNLMYSIGEYMGLILFKMLKIST